MNHPVFSFPGDKRSFYEILAHQPCKKTTFPPPFLIAHNLYILWKYPKKALSIKISNMVLKEPSLHRVCQLLPFTALNRHRSFEISSAPSLSLTNTRPASLSSPGRPHKPSFHIQQHLETKAPATLPRRPGKARSNHRLWYFSNHKPHHSQMCPWEKSDPFLPNPRWNKDQWKPHQDCAWWEIRKTLKSLHLV